MTKNIYEFVQILWCLDGFVYVFGHCGFLFCSRRVKLIMLLGYLLKLFAKLLLSYFSYRFSKGINHLISHSPHFGILRIARPLHLIFCATMHKWKMASTPICDYGVIRSNRLTASKHLLTSTRYF